MHWTVVGHWLHWAAILTKSRKNRKICTMLVDSVTSIDVARRVRRDELILWQMPFAF